MYIENILSENIDNYVYDSNYSIIDLRDKESFERGHIINAINMPFERFQTEYRFLDKNKIFIVYCQRGGVSIMAAKILARNGYKVKNVIGGIKNYRGSSLTLK